MKRAVHGIVSFRHLKPRYYVFLVAVFTVAGVVLLLRSFAGVGEVAHYEPEKGSLSGNASIGSDATASGGQYIALRPSDANPTPPPTPNYDPLAISCQSLGYGKGFGGVTYTWWHIDPHEGLSSIKIEMEILSNHTSSDAIYFQAYNTPDISPYGDSTPGGVYFGVQTSGLLIFSFFGNKDAANIRAASGSYAYTADYEGDFISIRRKMNSMPSGKYIFEVKRSNFDGVGDWFEYYVTIPGQPQATHIGALRFIRQAGNKPVVLPTLGSSWVEYFDSNIAGASQKPYTVRYRIMEARGGADNRLFTVGAAQPLYNSEFPAGDVKVLNKDTLQVEHKGGGNTQRCHETGYVYRGQP